MVNKMEVGVEPVNTKDSVVKKSKLAYELSNTSLSSYLKDLYVNFLKRSSHPPGDHKDTATTIRSYKNQAKSASCGYYKFGMDKANIDEEEILHAELRLLQKISIPGDYYEVNIFYLLNNNSTDSPLKLTFKYTDSSPGWKTFDVTPIAKSWKQGWVNYGLKVTLNEGKRQLSCEGVYSSGEQNNILDTEPLLVMFTRHHNNKFRSKLLKDKRFHNTAHERVKRENQFPIQTSHVACHLQKMDVSNTAVSANNMYLLLPRLFDVGVCVGHCPRLPVESLTDHASILSLHYYQTRGHAKVPKRCCVPTDFEDILMLFYNDLTQENIFISAPAKATTCSCL
ncbi:bone morphogenetic protein 2-like isoform X2 [Dysidea avara]